MGKRFGKLITLAGLGLALARLTRLLEPSLETTPWEVLLIGSCVLGWLLTRALTAARAGARTRLAVHLGGITLLVARITAPGQLIGGIIPGAAALSEFRIQRDLATELIRFGAAPVLPVPGLIALLAIVFWVLGSLAGSKRPALATLPAIVVYLQFATFDRRAPGFGWILALALIGTAALVSLVPVPDSNMGRARSPDGALVPRRSGQLLGSTLATTALVGVLASTAFAASVPESGLLAWRTQSGIGSGLYGGGSLNEFVGLQQSLVNLSDEPMFYARVSQSAPENRELYWKLVTLDIFDGVSWSASDQSFAKRGNPRWERPDWTFQGPVSRVAANIRIAGYFGRYLPTLYSPVALASDEPLISESFRVREDGSVAIDVQAIDNWTYQLDVDLPVSDFSVMASTDGRLSPMFETAAEAGVFPAFANNEENTQRPESLSRFTTLPSEVTTAVRDTARTIASGGTTPFERALLLEAFFRDPEQFTYSTDVDTGHSALNLEDWLLTPDSRNYRTGYCEQFATAMAVMARSVGIPSRVVLGYTPGEVTTQADGSDVIVVRENNAHAWVELWMDGQGWVRFDPTPRGDGVNPSVTGDGLGFDPRQFVSAPNQNAAGAQGLDQLALPDRNPEERGGGLDELAGGAIGGLSITSAWLWWVAAILAAAALVPTTKVVRRRRRLTRISDGEVAVAWREIVDRLADLGAPVDPAATPLETALRESPDLVPLAELYSAAAYGGRDRVDCRDEFAMAESGLKRGYSRGRRRASWIKLNSLKQ